MELLAILFIIGFFCSRGKLKKKQASTGAIVGRGRSPLYLDIMEENYAELKAQLEADANAGKIYKRSKTQSLDDVINKVPMEYEEVSAAEALAEFKKYEANEYM